MDRTSTWTTVAVAVTGATLLLLELERRLNERRLIRERHANNAKLVSEMKDLSVNLQNTYRELGVLRSTVPMSSLGGVNLPGSQQHGLPRRQMSSGPRSRSSSIGEGLTEGIHGNPADLGKLVVIIGMRGAGKTSLGRKAAEELKRDFLDLDEILEKQVFGSSINEFVAREGWLKFRQQESQLLKDVIVDGKFGASAPNGAVVSCGGGIVESLDAIELLKVQFPVIWINRHIDDICEYLESSGAYRPSLGVSPRDAYDQRHKLYDECSDYIFTIRKGDQDWKAIDKDFVSFLRFAAQAPHHEVQLAPDTFFLSLTFPSIEDAAANPDLLRQLATNADVLELRADLMRKPTDEQWLLEELALLRRHVFAPIYFTLRHVKQGGRFEGEPSQSLNLLKLAVKAGCEIIDVDAALFTKEQINELFCIKGKAKLVGSHIESIRTLHRAEFEDALLMLTNKGNWDLLKIIQQSTNVGDVMEFYHYAQSMLPQNLKSKFFHILQGEKGKLSRILNRIMTPVTHPALPFPAAPGQIAMQDLIPLRHKLCLFEPQRFFYIFGRPVALSASPTMQNVGFKVNGKPHVYERYDTPSVEDVAWKLSLVSSGGGSITIPHKETLLPYLDETSEAVRAIGAVNTVTKEPDTNKLRGDNTDWIGIKQQLLPKVKGRNGDMIGLIIGAGGTARAAAYAFRSMGFAQIFIMNRTFDKAALIAKEFGTVFTAVQDANGLGELSRLDAVMGTLPGTANFTLPDKLLATHKPAVIEAAYRSSESGSRFTPLLQQAIDAGCETIEGIEMLFEQGCAQCEIWTGKSAPRKQIAQALLDDRFANDPNPPKNLIYEASL